MAGELHWRGVERELDMRGGKGRGGNLKGVGAGGEGGWRLEKKGSWYGAGGGELDGRGAGGGEEGSWRGGELERRAKELEGKRWGAGREWRAARWEGSRAKGEAS